MGSEGRGLRQRSERTLARAPALQAPLDAGQHGGLLLVDEEVPAVEQLQLDVGAGFLAPGQQLFLDGLVGTPAKYLADADFGFTDARLPELLFRYRARNWVDSLRHDERERWDGYRRQRLADTTCSEYTFDSFFDEVRTLRVDRAGDARIAALLDAVEAWGRERQAELA